MAGTNGVPDTSDPKLNLTPEEKRLFYQLFQAADTESVGVVTGDVAVKFFEKSKLEPRVLGEIWQIADTENRGFLTPAGFGMVLRLIGHVQNGQEPSAELALRPGPLPRFDGFSGTPIPAAIPPPPAGLQPQSSGGPIRVPPLTPEKVGEYSTLFDKSGAQNGILAGDQAKQIFERARLPNEVLGRIWNLADTEQRGALGVTEFVIAMHLLASYKGGALRALPNILPPGLYEAASRRGGSSRVPSAISTSPLGPAGGSIAGSFGIPRQFSGSGAPRAQSPATRLNYGTPPQSAQTTGSDWAISPKTKVQFDNVFASLDKSNRGVITGDEAVPFFSNSRLPEEVLAQIWDLADINSEGHLNKDEFAVAMHLIRQQRGTRDGRGTLPSVLPPSLIPPSMRQQIRPPQQPTAPAFDNAGFAPTTTKSAADDLFGLDAFTTSSPAPSQTATGGPAPLEKAFDSDPFGSSAQPSSPNSSQGLSRGSPQQSSQSTFKPFIPSSSFGQNIMSSSITGGSSGSAPSQSRLTPQPPSAMDDLLGDNDPEVSKKLTAETSELANLSNQVGSLSRQMQEVKATRSTTEQDLAQASTQKRDFEMRLSQLRALYEREVKDVKALEDRLLKSRSETKKLQQDIALIEGTFEDLQNQHRQVAVALEADQRENSNLKERMRSVNAEIDTLKPQLEKLRSEARQQKGLVAINKKQLATNEGEREKVRGEIADVSRTIQEAAATPSVSSHTQSPAAVASPAASMTSQSTNPFFRRSNTTSSDMTTTGVFPSTTATPSQQTQKSFDNVFGPSFSGAASSASIPTETKGGSVLPVPSGQSVRSSEGQDISTPPSSPPASSKHESPRSTEPPPPPESRQITSSILPFRDHLQRSESLGSSVKVSAPASRYGGNEASGTETPTNWDSPSSETTRQTPELALRGLDNANSDLQHPSESQAVTDSAPAPREAPPEFEPSAPSRDTIPGAFPADQASPVEPTVTGGSTFSNQSRESNRASEGFHSARSEGFSSRSDPFSPGRDQGRPTPGKDDFDAAFSGFASKLPQERQNTGGSSTGSLGNSSGGGKFNKEFPPIEEFGHDEESDSASEHGFDDDFAPATTHQRNGSLGSAKAMPQQPVAQNGATVPAQESFVARPSLSDVKRTSTGPLPPANAQKSPPSYDQTIHPSGQPRGSGDSTQFPPEFTGLLPSREDPTTELNSVPKPSSPTLTGGQSLFGGSTLSKGAPSSAQTTFSSPPLSNTPASTAPSDAYQSAVSYASGGKGPSPPAAQVPQPSKAAFDDFDNEFADLADAREADDRGDDEFGVSSHHPEGFDDFNPVFDTPSASQSTTLPPPERSTRTVRPVEDAFSDFESNLGSGQGVAASKAPQQPAAATSHDWDAIFAGLDAPTGPSGPSAQPSLPPKEPIGFRNDPDLGTSSSLSPSTRAKPPPVGRALSTGTEHDDPILKRLMGMGYPRNAALGALEKYDYNIDKAADHLVQQLGK